MFTTSDLSLNQYHHVFFQVARDTSNVITAYMYDNDLNALGTLDTSFGSHPILNVFQVLDASGSNPLVIGKGSSYQYNLDVAHFAIYNRTLTTTQQATLMNYTNETFLEPHTESTLYMVSASGGKFYIDNVEAPVLDVSHGIYVFDQRDSTNGIHPLRLSTVSDGTRNGGTEYTRGVVTNGTPGSINAYTLIQIDNLTPPILYYYCSNHGGMGNMLSLVDYTYFVKVVQNAIGDSVYAFSEDGVTYYNQPPLSFVAPYIYQFNLVGSMVNYDLAFGTEVDNANTVIDSYYITSMNATQFVLDLRNHNGNALYYFDSSFNNMGYYTYPSVGSIDEGPFTVTDPLAGMINANTYTVSGYSSSSFADGIYDLSASSYVETTNLFYKVLDVSGTGFDWVTAGDLYDSDGKYTGSTSTMIGNVEYKGEWIQLRLPYHLVLSDLITNNDATDLDSSPKTVHLLGSNDNGSTFDYLSEASLGKTATATATTFSSVYQRYSTFRMIVEDTHGGSNVHLGFWSLEGTAVREYPENSVAHTMTVSGSPEVYYIDNIPQDEIDFSINVVYLFDQSDTTNANYQVFFSGIADDPPNTGYMEIVGSPGRTGAYTKLQLDASYPGQWFYYSTTRDYMGYGPIELGPDSFNKVVGDVVTFTVINRTGVVEPYSITGVTSADIGGADLSGIIEYGRKYDLSYSLVTANKTMVFAVGDVSSSLVIGDYKYYEVAVQPNVVGKPVFAFYDTTDAVWYNQPELSFHKQQVYEFDLSNSVTDNSYVLVFGTEMDNSGTVVSSSTFVDRSQNNKVILNLRDYIGESLVYFEDSSSGMGYVEMPAVDVSHAVTVSGSPEVFYLDGSANPSLDFSANTSYVFDQSDSTNADQQIVFGYAPDNTAILTAADGVTIMGTPGRPGAYTTLDLSSSFVGPLYYYSDGSANMGMDVIPGQTYGVKVQQNVIGQYVYAFDLCGNGDWYNQPDLSFSAPNVYEFDVSDPSNNGYVLTFGTTVDVSSTVVESDYILRDGTPGSVGAMVILNLTGYNGSSLVYFEDSSAGMGYVEHDVDTAVTYSDPNNPYNPDKNSREFYLTNPNGKSGYEDACQLDTTAPYQAWKAAPPWDNYTGTYKGAYMQINLTADTDIAGVITQGNPNSNRWCTSYSFAYSTDNITFYDIDGRTSWGGNSDASTWHYNYFASTLTARYVRIYPLTFQNGLELRAGLFLGQIGDITNDYAVTVSNKVFYIDGSANPPFDFSASNLYVFDQSDPTNVGQQIVFGYAPDNTTHILTAADGVTVMGTPGQPGAYTQLDLSAGFVGPLYYYSDGSANMGYIPSIPVDISYSFTVKMNIYDEPVWALYDENNSVWYNQPDLSFGTPYVYEFDVSDPSNNGYVLSFGTIVDVSDATIESTYVTRTNTPGTTDAKVLLDLRDYSGVSLVYFEDSSAGMGYVVFESSLADSFVVTSVLSGWPSGDLSYSVTGNGKSFVNGTYHINISDPVGGGVHLSRVLSSGSDGYPGYDYYSENGSYTNGTESGTHDTTTVSGATYNGSWIELSLPYKLQLNQLEIHGRSSSHLEWLPKKVHFLGSNDGSNYHFLQTITLSNQLTQVASIPNITDAFTTIRMVTETLQGTSSTATKINVDFWSIAGTVNLDVTVSGSPEVFYIDGSANPSLDFSANTSYVFDQSDSTNVGQQLVFGYTPDNTANIFTAADGVTVMGTPGRPGAYTQLDLSSGFVGPLYYYSDGSANMGMDWLVDQMYSVKVQQNTIGQYVYAFDLCGNGDWYNQPDLSFTSPYSYGFDVSDPSNNGYVLTFGTTVDDNSTVVASDYIVRDGTPGSPGAMVILNLAGYSGSTLVYFEDSSAGMGYIGHDAENVVTYSDPNNPYNPDQNSREFYDSTNNEKSQLVTTLTVDSWKANGPWSNYTGTYMGAYMQINLTADTDIAGVITQGSPLYNRWCTSFRFRYSTDNTNFYDIDGRTSWEGNSDGSTWHYNYFASTLTARYVRIYPLTFQGGPHMRAGLFLGQIRGINDYALTVSNEVFYLDGSANPSLDFSANTSYVFDQSDPTNVGQQLVFGYAPDDTVNILTSADGVVVMGTPGQPGAYTQLDLSSGFVGPLYYYSDGSANMGYTVTNYETLFSSVTEPSFYWDFRTTSPLTDASGEYVEDVINGSIKARAVGNLSFNSLSGPTFNDNDYVDIDDFKFGGACSIEVYFNITQFTSLGRIIDFASSTSGGDNVILRVDSNGITFQLRIGTGTSGQITPNIYSSVSTNTWYHVIATVESSGNVEAYVDGSSTNLNATFNSSGGGVVDVLRTVNFAGNDTWYQGGQNLNGNLAFVRVWYGHVLTSSEVVSLYNNRELIGIN